MTPNSSAGAALRWFVATLGTFAVIGGATTLLGWFASIPRLTDWIDSGISMLPNAAVGVVCSAAAVILATLNRRWSTRLSALLGAGVALLGLATLFQHISGIALGIDTLVFAPTWGTKAAVAPGRIGPPASTSFTMLGLALLFLASGKSSLRRIVPALGIAVASIAVLSLMGYLAGAEPLFAARYSGIAMQTASVLLALGLAVVASAPECEPLRTIRGNSAASLLARRSLPFIIAVPLVLGLLRIRGQQAGLFDTAMGTSLLMLLVVLIFSGLLWWWVGTVAKHERELQHRTEQLEHSHDALCQAQNRLELALEGSGSVVWGWNAVDNRLDDWTPQYRELYGFRPDEPPRFETWLARIHSADRDRLTARTQQMLKSPGDNIWNEEFRINHPERGEQWIGGSGRAFRDETGRVLRMAGVNSNITERKKAEKLLFTRVRQQSIVAGLSRLALSGTSLQEIMDRAVQEIAGSLGVDYCKILELLPSGKELLLRAGIGWRDGLVGKATVPADSGSQAGFTLINNEAVVVEPDLASETRFSAEPLLVEHGVRSGISCVIRRSDGRPFWVLGAHSRQTREFAADDVKFLQSVANVLGLTIQNRQAEQALRESEARMSGLVTSAMDAVIAVDGKQRVVLFNPTAEKIFGVAAVDALGSSLDRFIPARFREAHRGHVEKFSQTGVTNRRMGALGALTGVRANGDEFPIEASISQMGSGDEKVFTVILRDITERKRAEDALRQAHAQLASRAVHLEKLVEQRTAKLNETVGDLETFSYSIVHDLRAPLRAMNNFARLLADECGPISETANDYVRRITTAAERMDRLIQEVLNYGRIARADVSLAPVDAGTLLRGMLETYPTFQPPHADVELTGNIPRVLANEAALTQCLSNLLGNAVKFVAPGVTPRVRVWAEPRDLRVRLFFQDNGIGIEKEAHEKIFEMFQRLSKRYDGTGVGLTIVKKAIEKMGGKVGLESEPGKGSTFWIELPAATPEAVPAEPTNDGKPNGHKTPTDITPVLSAGADLPLKYDKRNPVC